MHWLLANETYQKAVIFTNTRAQADRLYGHLVASDVKVFVLHGEKDQKERKLAIERLKQGASRCSWPPTWRRAAWTSKAWIW